MQYHPDYGWFEAKDQEDWEDDDFVAWPHGWPEIFVFEQITDIPYPHSNWMIFGTLEEWRIHLGETYEKEWWEKISDIGGAIGELGLTIFDPVMDPIEEGMAWIGETYKKILDPIQKRILKVIDENTWACFAAIATAGIALSLAESATVMAAYDWLKEKYFAIEEKVAPLVKSITERIDQAKEYYTKFAEFIHLEELRQIDYVLSLTWDAYYEKKCEIIEKLGQISQELFGDVHVLNQWLALGGMIWKDYAAATGKTWSEQDMEWLVKTNQFMLDIEDSLGYYAKHPERLWIRIEDALVRPIYEARGEAYTGWDSERAELRGWIGKVEKFYRTLDRKVLEYQLALPENIRDELGPDLIKFRKDLREIWKGDLVPVITFLKDRLDLHDDQWVGYDRWKAIADPKISNAASLLSSPAALTPQDRASQAERFTEIEAAMIGDYVEFTTIKMERELPLYGKAVREVLNARK